MFKIKNYKYSCLPDNNDIDLKNSEKNTTNISDSKYYTFVAEKNCKNGTKGYRDNGSGRFI